MIPQGKHEKTMSPPQAASLLRDLAAWLEKGQLEFGDVMVELDTPLMVKHTVKTKSDKISFKLKMKYEKHLSNSAGVSGGIHPLLERDDEDEDEDERAAGGGPGYKKLKKAMSKVFKQMGQNLEEGRLPSPDQVQTFCEQGRLMTTYAGKGDEFYSLFLGDLERLRAAVEAQNLEAARDALAGLEARRKACHAEHK